MANDPAAPARTAFEARMRPLLNLADRFPDASDVFVNGDAIWLARGAEKTEMSFGDFEGLTPRDVRFAANNAAVYADTEFSARKPMLSIKMPPNYRVTYVRPPVGGAWYLDIRFLRSSRLRLADYVGKSMEAADVACIRGLLDGSGGASERMTTDGRGSSRFMEERPNIAISGAPGSGKTTLLLAMLQERLRMSSGKERIVLIEDTSELSLPGSSIVSLVTAPEIGIEMDDLLKITLRLTPDCIVVGEVRSKEAMTLAMAMNTGFSGTLFTIHSNGGLAAVERMHELMRLANPNVGIEEAIRAVDVVIQMEGKGTERRLSGIFKVPKSRERKPHIATAPPALEWPAGPELNKED